MNQAVILEAVRTPFARRGGALREVRPDTLLSLALRGLVERSGIDAAKIEDVVNGTVTLAGEQGANPGRLGVLLAGFPVTTAGVSLNRMCGSSQQAVHFAAQAIAAGDMNYAIGSGVESMSRVPMFLDISFGKPVSGFEALNPELWEHHDLIHQGESAERVGERWNISRGEADEFSKASHRKASAAREAKRNKEIIAVAGLGAEGERISLAHDDGVRAVLDEAKMAALKPAFRPDGRGSVTAANSSQISDGAAAVLVANEAVARADGFKPKARFRARVVVGSDPTLQLTGVIAATQKALQKAGLSVKDIDWFEVNEAFATVVLSWAKDVGADLSKVNPWGGAIAHGHPLGATGAGLMAKMLAGLEATGGQFGLQTMCIGHGMATASVVERI
jgi:acetyl-CoA acyltransferase